MENLSKHAAVRYYAELAQECGELTGELVLSLPDLSAWAKQGKPKIPTPHRWTDPVDGVITCVWCGAQDDCDERDYNWCPEPQAN